MSLGKYCMKILCTILATFVSLESFPNKVNNYRLSFGEVVWGTIQILGYFILCVNYYLT